MVAGVVNGGGCCQKAVTQLINTGDNGLLSLICSAVNGGGCCQKTVVQLIKTNYMEHMEACFV